MGMRKFWLSRNVFANGFLWLVGLAMQIGGWISPIIAFVLLGIAFVWSICTFIYWQRNKDRITNEYQWEKCFGVTPILQKMDERIRNLAKQEGKRVIDFKEYNEINKIINKDIIKVKVTKPTTIKGLKKAANTLETIIDKRIKDEIITIQSGAEKLAPISSFLDAKGFGLKQQRENDKRYTRLATKLQYYRNLPLGSEIDNLINLHIAYSEISANMLLVNIRAHQVKIENTNVGFTDVISTQMQIITEQTENNMKEIASIIRARITDCIRGLEIKGNKQVPDKTGYQT